MANMSWSLWTTVCLLMMSLGILVMTIDAVPVAANVNGEGTEGADLKKDLHHETIEERIINSFGGPKGEKEAEEKRKKEKGEETEGFDTVLTQEQVELLHGNGENGVSKRRLANFVTLWTDGVVPYEWGILNGDAQKQAMMQEVFDEWATHTCVSFVPAQPNHQHRIKFMDKGGCYSYLGETHNSEQEVSLASTCHSKGIYLHELGHALGLVHEQQLPQRDNYITIDLANVQSGMEDQFTRYGADIIPNAEQVAYSYRSIMHYGKYAFSKQYGSLQTIHAKDVSEEPFMGTGQSLAFSDAKVINLLYNCAGRCSSPPSVCQAPCFVNEHCQCICKQDMP